MSPFEILKEANNIDSVKERVEFLQENMRPSLAAILACVFNPKITFPDYSIDIEYKVLKNAKGIVDVNFDRICRKLYIFEEATKVRYERRKALLIQFLEGMHEEDSNFLFKFILQKKLPFNRISKSFIEKNLPGILNYSIRPRT
jgi:hypothetical protein